MLHEGSDAERVRLLNQKEREEQGNLGAMQQRFNRAVQRMLGQKQASRFQTFQLNEMEPFCSSDEIEWLSKCVQEAAKKSAPQWAAVASYSINAEGKISVCVTKIPTKRHPVSRLADKNL